MVFSNLKTVPLPPLFAFFIYFTHAIATPENTDMSGLLQELKSQKDDRPIFRLDMHFLPGEKAVRENYKKQDQVFKTRRRYDVHPPPGTDFELPVMVRKYDELGQALLICSKKRPA